jgi:ABC-type multidrug transport system ATPase subunit/ABC-type multidrug transport system permease subunit
VGAGKGIVTNLISHIELSNLFSSTLLDLLADRKLIGQWAGDIYFNHGPRSKFFDRDSAYILQDDLHYGTLTVRETIYYSACFKLPEGTSKAEIEQRVDELLRLMGLSHVQDSLVGDQTHKGISGGQMKRLSIAVEIVSMPDLIFLDEPTSGLDSTMALEVMQASRKLADQNRTCIATIHQPSPEVFALFDKVVLLCNGRLIYYGPSRLVVDYFTSSDLNYFFEDGQNPAEFIIDIGEGIIKPVNRIKPFTTDELEGIYMKSKYRYVPPSADAIRNAHSLAGEEKKGGLCCSKDRRHATTSWTQFKLLTERNILAIIRDIPEITAQLAKNIVVGLLIGVVFYQQARTTTPLFGAYGIPNPEVQNISALLFFGTMFTMMSNMQAIPYLCSRNLIFRREVASYAYSVAPYFFSHILTVIPLQFLGFSLFAITVYFLCEFPAELGYFSYYFTLMFLAAMNAYYFAMLLASATQSATMSLVLFPITFLFLSTFAGFAIPVNDVPVFWSWAPYIDYIRWTFQGLMTNQWAKYDDDDSASDSVLSLYGMEGFNKMDSYWILGLATGIILVGVYFGMRPPRKGLVKLPREQLTRNTFQESLNSLSVASNPLQANLLNAEEQANTNHAAHSSNLTGPPPLKRAVSDLESSHSASERALNFEIDSTGVKPLLGYFLTFRDVAYSVDVKNTQTGDISSMKILKGVSGRVEPKEMCALMGASGAGKSTLLDVLADRKTVGEIFGEIFINGRRRTRAMMKSTAYVMQDNAHIGSLTVQETLYFAAQLRLPQYMAETAKEERIQDILRILGLHHIANSVGGNEERRGISGGQKKRLSIGVEIIHLPEMIFLDEPTTGLDSAIAYEVMFAVRQIANQNRTVLCTIHQPSTYTFELFDKVMLLGAGQMFYFGKRESIVNYFTQSVYRFPHKSGSNPADYIIAISCQAIPSGIDGNERISPDQLIEMYQQTSLYKDFYTKIDEMIQTDKFNYANAKQAMLTTDGNEDDDNNTVSNNDRNFYHTSLLFQIKTLVHRLLVRKRREYLHTIACTLRVIAVAIFYGTIYYQLPTGTDITDYQNRIAILFFSLLSELMNHQEDIPELHEDRLIFYREQSAQAYTIFAYWISKFLIALPFDFINVFLYSVILYNLVGFRSTNDAFPFFLMIMWITNYISLLICQSLAFFSSNTEIAMSLFPMVLFFVTAFEGFVIYLPEFPDWLGWAANVSYMRFAYQSLVLNEFQGNDELPLSTYYIDMLGFNTFSKTKCACFLLIFFVFHGLASFLAVKFINFEKR